MCTEIKHVKYPKEKHYILLFYMKNLAVFPQAESETKNRTPQIYKRKRVKMAWSKKLFHFKC